MPLDCHLTTTWLPLDYHLTSTWLPLDCQLITTYFPLDYHLTATGVPLNFHLTTTWLPLDCNLIPLVNIENIVKITPSIRKNWPKIGVLAQILDCKGIPFEYFRRWLSTNENPRFQALDQSQASILTFFLLWLILEADTSPHNISPHAFITWDMSPHV